MSILQRLTERFWFVPAVLCVAAVVLAESLIALDRRLSDLEATYDDFSLFYQVGESGSRDILGAIATSSLAVAGTTFSITIAVLALASSSYGPRLVRNFMADRGNQVVLGVFVGTFLYSLLTLRSIRVIGDPGESDAEVFIPHIATNVAVLLAVANVAVLVYFIHHISDSIQVSTLASEVRSDLLNALDRMYPEQAGDALPPHSEQKAAEALSRAVAHGAPVTAGRCGYVQSIRDDDLMTSAHSHDVFLALQIRPGQYVLEDTVAVLVDPPDRAGDALIDAVRSALQIADSRSPYQDPEFSVQQLTEMAVRALSAGTNDPYTAVNALDDLSVGLARMAERAPPSPVRVDSDHVPRIHAPVVRTEDLVASVVDSMRWYATGSPGVMHAVLDVIARVGVHARTAELRGELVGQVDLLQRAFEVAEPQERDLVQFTMRAAALRSSMVDRS